MSDELISRRFHAPRMFLVHLFVLFFVQRTSTEEILSISARLGSAVIFPIESHDESKPRSIEWRRNETTLKFDVDRYRWINRTSLMIERTIVGDEGFYTLKIDASTKTIRFHVRASLRSVAPPRDRFSCFSSPTIFRCRCLRTAIERFTSKSRSI